MLLQTWLNIIDYGGENVSVSSVWKSPTKFNEAACFGFYLAYKSHADFFGDVAKEGKHIAVVVVNVVIRHRLLND